MRVPSPALHPSLWWASPHSAFLSSLTIIKISMLTLAHGIDHLTTSLVIAASSGTYRLFCRNKCPAPAIYF